MVDLPLPMRPSTPTFSPGRILSSNRSQLRRFLLDIEKETLSKAMPPSHGQAWRFALRVALNRPLNNIVHPFERQLRRWKRVAKPATDKVKARGRIKSCGNQRTHGDALLDFGMNEIG